MNVEEFKSDGLEDIDDHLEIKVELNIQGEEEVAENEEFDFVAVNETEVK